MTCREKKVEKKKKAKTASEKLILKSGLIAGEHCFNL